MTPGYVVEPENGVVISPALAITDPTASNGSAVKFGSSNTIPPATDGCSVSAALVNSCRPWIGAYANTYSQVGSGLKNQTQFHEQRINRQLDMIKDYLTPGQTLSSDDKYFITRPHTYMEINWKPASSWKDAAGGNQIVNTQIDMMADSVKSVAPNRLMLVIFHEPEDNVKAGTSACTQSRGTAGSPADYRAMWQNVRNRFDAKGVNNVSWGMAYQGYIGWSCVAKDLWPGNNLVDWILWDPYDFGSNTATWDGIVGPFYNWLATNSDTSHDFNSKTWGLAEFGIGRQVTQAATYRFYDEAKAALDNNTYPKLKLYMVFDAIGPDNSGGTDDLRTLYDASGVIDQTEQNHYNLFVNDAHFK